MKLEPLDNRLGELNKEENEIIKLRNVLPYRKVKNEINLQGDLKDIKNILEQTDQIKEQVADFQQTMGRGQSRSR